MNRGGPSQLTCMEGTNSLWEHKYAFPKYGDEYTVQMGGEADLVGVLKYEGALDLKYGYIEVIQT